MRTTMKKRAVLALMMITLAAVTASPCFADYDRETVRQVQEALNKAGFDCGTPDGIAGKKTAGAVQKYQESKGMKADGVLSDEILRSLGIGAGEDLTEEPEEETSYIEFDENCYPGVWVTFADAYEVYIPEDMVVQDADALTNTDDAEFSGIDGIDSQACLRCSEENGDGIAVSVDAMKVTDAEALKNIGASSAQELYEMLMSVYMTDSKPVKINGITGVPLTFVFGEDFSFIWLDDETIYFMTCEHHDNEADIASAENILASLRKTDYQK